jgi:general secretion pathway protein K
MRIRLRHSESAIALIIVLLVVVVLGLLAASFAYTMKVETKLARNATFDAEFEWLGRSGVELARYILAQESLGPGAQFDSLMQKWAGGPGDTNNTLFELPMENFDMGEGRSFSIKIVDQDRKFNINAADRLILQEALTMIGVDQGAQASIIVDSILDWRDRDDMNQISGAESDDYTTNPNPGYPPYLAKNGPVDDLSELLMVRGITPAMYWGSGAGDHPVAMRRRGSQFEEPVYPVGFADLFTALSSGRVNINTASATVLQVIPLMSGDLAQSIIARRAGPDGADGTIDDMPFRSTAEVPMGFGPGMAPGPMPGSMPPPVPGAVAPPGANPMGQFLQFFTVKSLIFEARVEANIGGTKRSFIALLRRGGPRDLQVLNMYWK